MLYTDFTINILSQKPNKYNNNRLINFTPIMTTKASPLVINYDWYEKLHNKMKKSLNEEFQNITLDDFDVPVANTFIEETDDYWKFLGWYKREFMFDCYEYIFDDCCIINLNDNEINELLGLCILYNNLSKNDEEINDFWNNLYVSDELYEKIKIQMEKCDINNTGVFVKTSIKSAKHYAKLYPCFTVKDIIKNLIVAKEVIQSLLTENCNIIVRQWNNNINVNNEFRVFVLDKKIKCISQQKLEKINIVIEPNDIIKSILLLWDNVKNKLHYNDCVIDCYIHNNIANIIEINSGDAWSTAGSALFTWEEIKCDNLYELRLLL